MPPLTISTRIEAGELEEPLSFVEEHGEKVTAIGLSTNGLLVAVGDAAGKVTVGSDTRSICVETKHHSI